MANFGDVIIVIPGIFGSRLERKDGTLFYDLTLARLPRTLWTLAGQGMSHLRPDAPPDDGVVATDLFNYQLLPGFFGNEDYGALLAALRNSVPYPDQQVIKFPYDWRASNRWAAEQLDRVARDALKAWRAASGNAQAKLWLVCHSMGGLVARYFCEHLGGAEITRELITICTPHRGAAKALDVLVNGMRLGGLIDISRFVQSLPSVYELLPQYPVLRDVSASGSGAAFRLADAYGLGDRLPLPRRAQATGTPEPAPAFGGGLPKLDRSMLERAVDFHAAIRHPVVKRMDEGAPAPYTVRCFLNRRQPTFLSALLRGNDMQASSHDPLVLPDAQADPAQRGDGTVAAFAAVPIEWDDTSNAIAVSAKHVGMPASTVVTDALHNWIHPLDARAHMGGGVEDRDVLGLLVPGAIRQGEDLAIEVDALTAANVTVTVEPPDGSKPAVSIRTRVPGNGQPVTLDLGKFAQGAWRVTITPEDRRRPAVSDYVLVLAGG